MIITERLEMAPVSPADTAALHAVFTQPGVRRVIFDDQVIPPEQTAGIVSRSAEMFASEQRGLWTARLRAQPGTLIGFGGLWYFREPPELELLYGVADEHVGQGFGLEIVNGVVEYAFTVLRMEAVRASTDAGHAASVRILEKAGFVFDRRAVVAGLDTVFFGRDRPQPARIPIQ